MINVFQSAFPSNLKESVDSVWNEILKAQTSDKYPASLGDYEVVVDGEHVKIPSRFYYEELPSTIIKSMPDEQQLITHCIYSRHSNGFTRQKHLECMFGFTQIPSWTFPFIVKLCDEYVPEILELIYLNSSKINSEQLSEFVGKNQRFIARGYSRMTSYWDCYYRYRYPNLKEYVGYKIYKDVLGYDKKFLR